QGRDRCVVRAHHPADPGAQRQRRRARRDDIVGGRQPRARRAHALHGVPPGLQVAGPSADAPGDAVAGAAHRHRQRGPPRVHGQRPRPRRAEHFVRDVRRAGDRARLVPTRRVPPRRGWPLPRLRRAAGRRVRRAGGHVGPRPPAHRRRARRGSTVTGGAQRVRLAAVAGAFYPRSPQALRDALTAAFADAKAPPPGAPVPKALVVPHAGYVYSGAVAATAYLRLAPARDRITRVVLLGPNHRVPLAGMAVSSADAFATPFGPVTVDDEARRLALALPGVAVDDDAHALEHSLEVQLPFLQTVLDGAAVLPVVVGQCPTADVVALLDALWGGP